MTDDQYHKLHQDEYDAGQSDALLGPGVNLDRMQVSAPYWQGYIDTIRHEENRKHVFVERVEGLFNA